MGGEGGEGQVEVREGERVEDEVAVLVQEVAEGVRVEHDGEVEEAGTGRGRLRGADARLRRRGRGDFIASAFRLDCEEGEAAEGTGVLFLREGSSTLAHLRMQVKQKS